MTCGIITYSRALNYGAMLQTYGLCDILRRLSCEPFVIDYIPERYDFDRADYKEKLISSTRRWKKIPVVRDLWADRNIIQLKQNRTVFRSFLESHVELTKSYHSGEELRKDLPQADVYITGSDQVWNSDFLWSGDVDGPYFFDFLPDHSKRISYASSFGQTVLTVKQMNAAKPLLAKYHAISVREKRGIEILNQMGLRGVETLDPVLLAGAECFRTLIPHENIATKPFLLLFQINFDKQLYKLVRALAKANGMEAVAVLPDVGQAHKCRGKRITLPEVEEWLWLIDNARFVVTDSLHATAFLIIFNKPFVSSVFRGYTDRIRNLLDIAGLQNRLLMEYDYQTLADIYSTTIDYKAVNSKIGRVRQDSMDWLCQAMNIGTSK